MQILRELARCDVLLDRLLSNKEDLVEEVTTAALTVVIIIWWR